MDRAYAMLAPATPTQTKPETVKSVAHVIYSGPEAIETRLGELDREWTVGRVVPVVAGLGIFLGLALALTIHGTWLILPLILGLLLLQHSAGQWSLLTWMLQPMGFRMRKEVEHERIALKALRGDFRNLPTVYDKSDEEALDRLADEGGLVNGPEITKPDHHSAADQVLDILKQ